MTQITFLFFLFARGEELFSARECFVAKAEKRRAYRDNPAKNLKSYLCVEILREQGREASLRMTNRGFCVEILRKSVREEWLRMTIVGRRLYGGGSKPPPYGV